MSKEKRDERMAEIVEDGRLVQTVIEEQLKDRVEEFKQLPIMRTIFKENVVVTEKTVDEKKMIEVTEVEVPKQTIFDPRDPSIQMGRKGKCSWVGSKCHVVETAEKGQTHFITDMIYQPATEHDVRVHEQIVENNQRMGLDPDKLFTDTAYVSGESLKLYQDQGMELMGYLEASSSPRSKEFQPEGFDIDVEQHTAVCPAGHRNSYASVKSSGELKMTFDRKTCERCQFFEACVRSSSQKALKRTLYVGPFYPYIRARRVE